MNDQFKIELQSLLARYPDVHSVTVKMVQTFEVKAAFVANSNIKLSPQPESLNEVFDATQNPTMAALLAGEKEILKNK